MGEFKLTSEALGTGPEAEIHCKNVIGGTIWNEGSRGKGLLEGWGTNACKAPAFEKLLETVFEKQIAAGLIRAPITVFATGELPLEEEKREAEVCDEEAKTKLSECPAESEKERTEIYWHIRRAVTSLPVEDGTQLGSQRRSKSDGSQNRLWTDGPSCYPTEKVEENGETFERPAKWQAVPKGCVRITVVAPQIPVEEVFYGALEPTFYSGAGNGLNASHMEFGTEPTRLVSTHNDAPETTVGGELKLGGSASQQLIFAK